MNAFVLRNKTTATMISLRDIIVFLRKTMIGQSPIIISLIFSRGKDTEIMQTSKKT
jgi:hypothetical protein